MKKFLIIPIILLLCSFSLVYYFVGAGGNTTALPGGTVSVTPQFRVLGGDSLRNIWVNYGTGWNRMYTATEINKYFFPNGASGYIQNQTSLKQPASFRLNGTGMFGTLGGTMTYLDSTQIYVYKPTDYANISPTQLVLNHVASGTGYQVLWNGVANAYEVSVGGSGKMILGGNIEVSNAPSDPNNPVRKSDLDAVSTAGTPNTRTISTGYGLLGGGDLSANRTLVADTTVTVTKIFAARYITAASTDVLLNKSISGTTNTFTNIPNSALTNSTISGIALGGSLANLTATDATLTFSGTYNGSTARTIGLNLGNGNTWTTSQVFSNVTYPISISRAAGNSTGIRWVRPGSLSRFDMYIDAVAESGGNAGSGLHTRYFNDAGTALGDLWFANRDGIVNFPLSPIVPTASANDNSTKAASTAYVDNAIASAVTQVVEITGTSQSAIASRIYIPHNASLTTITIPTTTVIGSLYQVVGEGSGGWKVQLTAGQTAVGVGITTTSGGSISSTDRYCTITMRLAATNKFVITSSQGTLTPL